MASSVEGEGGDVDQKLTLLFFMFENAELFYVLSLRTTMLPFNILFQFYYMFHYNETTTGQRNGKNISSFVTHKWRNTYAFFSLWAWCLFGCVLHSNTFISHIVWVYIWEREKERIQSIKGERRKKRTQTEMRSSCDDAIWFNDNASVGKSLSFGGEERFGTVSNSFTLTRRRSEWLINVLPFSSISNHYQLRLLIDLLLSKPCYVYKIYPFCFNEWKLKSWRESTIGQTTLSSDIKSQSSKFPVFLYWTMSKLIQ